MSNGKSTADAKDQETWEIKVWGSDELNGKAPHFPQHCEVVNCLMSTNCCWVPDGEHSCCKYKIVGGKPWPFVTGVIDPWLIQMLAVKPRRWERHSEPSQRQSHVHCDQRVLSMSEHQMAEQGFQTSRNAFLDGPNFPEQGNHGTYGLELRQTQKVRERVCQVKYWAIFWKEPIYCKRHMKRTNPMVKSGYSLRQSSDT